jgi:hypothetical protein
MNRRHTSMLSCYQHHLGRQKRNPLVPCTVYVQPMYRPRIALKSNLSISTLTRTITPPVSTKPTHSPLSRHRSSKSLSHSSSRSVPAPDSNQPDPTRYASALTPLTNRRLLSHRRNILASNLPVLHRETLHLSSLVGRFLLFPGT